MGIDADRDPSPLLERTSLAGVIDSEGGRVTFARFMELALTHPTLGYYSRVGRLLRHGGDFSTAPALSPFFNRTLARLVTELVDASLAAEQPAPNVGEPPSPAALVELGGGEGHLAREILQLWERERPEFRGRVGCRILETGARLREKQASQVSEWTAAGWEVGWGATLEEACAGVRPVVTVGNEFLDTMPVHVVDVTGGVAREIYVESTSSGLVQTHGDLSAEAAGECESLFGTIDPERLRDLTEDGILEIVPGSRSLPARVAQVMPRGSLVNVDYGEWFVGTPHSPRTWGVEERRRHRTVRGYFKHQMETDPLLRAGRQDLTADVDFAAVDLHGREMGFETVVFTTLAAFLRGGGADAELLRLRTAETLETLEADRQAAVLSSLADVQGLGGVFKLMVQVKD